MSLQIGIVGLPNVGKSTLFNAITKSSLAAAENFPFCTIDPNVGTIEVPDTRLDELATIVHPQRIVCSVIEFVDIAGLVKGASTGEGLGNQFLSHIRNCDAIAMVVRFFEDSNIHHVDGNINPQRDREVVETELILADLQTVEKNLDRAVKGAKSGKKEDVIKKELCERLNTFLAAGNPARKLPITEEEVVAMQELHLLTQKPTLFIVNCSEDDFTRFQESAAREKLGLSPDEIIVPICAKTECDLMDFSDEEAQEIMQSLGIQESGLSKLIRSAFQLLGLESFFTAGEKEVRAWTVHKNSTAPQAAGVIHTDFEKKFIKAEVCQVSDFVKYNGWGGVRENGALKMEGRDALIHDGDICIFKVGA
ncbi:MAG: redox-regulated ATPase YchF [Candidatus Peregrinibacteria bacterium]